MKQEFAPEQKIQKQPEDREQADSSEQELNDQDPGERQKRNQNDQKDDPLAA